MLKPTLLFTKDFNKSKQEEYFARKNFVLRPEEFMDAGELAQFKKEQGTAEAGSIAV